MNSLERSALINFLVVHRAVVVGLVAISVLAAGAPLIASESITLSFSVEEGGTLKVETDWCSIEVLPSETGFVEVEVSKSGEPVRLTV